MWPALALLFAETAFAEWELVRDDGCFLREEEAGISVYAGRTIRGAPERWALRWVFDRSWGIERNKRGYRQVIPLRFSDGSQVNARARWDEQGRAMAVIPDQIQAFRSSGWVSLGDRKVSLEGAKEAWRRLMSCMGEPAAASTGSAQSARGWMRVEGHIGSGWARKHIRRLAAAMPLKGVVLNSDGGRVAEATQLARWIRQQRIATAVERECASACVLAFAGGVDRYLGPSARIGLHQFSASKGGSFSRGQLVTAETAEFFDEMGIDNDLALLGARVSATEMRWLTPDEVLRLKLATEELDNALPIP